MKNFLKKSGLVSAVAAGSLVAGMAAVQPAMAESSDDALEQRIMQLEQSLRAIQGELSRVQAEAARPMDRVQVLEERVAVVESVPKKSKAMVFFRGGYARNDHNRNGDILTDANSDNGGGGAIDIAGLGVNTTDLTGNGSNGDRDGWYMGAGIEHVLTDDLWGLWDNTEALGEIMFEYKEFDSERLNRAPLPTAANDSASGGAGVGSIAGVVCNGGPITPAGAGPYGNCSQQVTVSQFTLTAAPKIKFMEGSALRPWIIPVGFAFHVISPPSDGVTVLTIGGMAGAGLEYIVWKDIRVGVDARYHLTSNATDDVNVDGLTLGGYVGFGF